MRIFLKYLAALVGSVIVVVVIVGITRAFFNITPERPDVAPVAEQVPPRTVVPPVAPPAPQPAPAPQAAAPAAPPASTNTWSSPWISISCAPGCGAAGAVGWLRHIPRRSGRGGGWPGAGPLSPRWMLPESAKTYFTLERSFRRPSARAC